MSFLHHDWLTPIPAIIFIVIQLAVALALTCATFIDIQGLIQLLGIFQLMKIAMTIVCIMRLKWTHPTAERSITVPLVVVAVCFICLLAITILTVYEQPFQNGIGLTIFLLGIPMAFLGRYCSTQPHCSHFMEQVTLVTQKICMVVP
ncbi:hypothetical protein CAPTEDRAFT_187436 [Capitella teleta]|uniref:Amino acid permease/ SLC12A domain-containing protein n=1 Tax=Capitella teleta TaxID=283909 RepID=R7VKE2_CAPTE|nr:hypothetical protein CAPTEDRAFT_187436 [Capitella teleta]|eukprot:ELU17296.1 hypothetical protein CAPTEDRAFT_187436 [Capitella teleta]